MIWPEDPREFQRVAALFTSLERDVNKAPKGGSSFLTKLARQEVGCHHTHGWIKLSHQVGKGRDKMLPHITMDNSSHLTKWKGGGWGVTTYMNSDSEHL